MADLFRVLFEILRAVCPFQAVRTWQRGVWYVWGRYWRTVSPGIWPMVPGLMEIRPVDVVPSISQTPLQTITLRDGRSLTFSATITVQVDNPEAATNRVDYWPETTIELVSGLLSETLADVDPQRFDPARGKRDRLLEELRAEADAATAVFGVRIWAIRLNNFALGVRTYRLLSEGATMLPRKV